MLPKRFAILSSLVAFTLTLLLSGCSTSYKLQGTRLSPGSVGEVMAATDKNDNQTLAISVSFMPLPSQLAPELTTYVAWASPRDREDFSNLGQIKLNSERAADLETTTPYRDFELLITAETEPTVTIPSEYVVFKHNIVPEE